MAYFVNNNLEKNPFCQAFLIVSFLNTAGLSLLSNSLANRQACACVSVAGGLCQPSPRVTPGGASTCGWCTAVLSQAECWSRAAGPRRLPSGPAAGETQEVARETSSTPSAPSHAGAWLRSLWRGFPAKAAPGYEGKTQPLPLRCGASQGRSRPSSCGKRPQAVFELIARGERQIHSPPPSSVPSCV